MATEVDSDQKVTGYIHRSEYGEFLHNGRRVANQPPDAEPDENELPSIDELSDALRWIVDWCWMRPDGTSRTVRAACVRWLAVAHTLFRHRIGKNANELAGGLGLGGQSVKERSQELRGALSIRPVTTRNRK
jgi:hypothetical protein